MPGPLLEFRSGHGLTLSWPGGEIRVPEAGQEANRFFEAYA